MRLKLTSDGLGPAALGMTHTEIAEALKTWGTPQPFSRTPGDAPGWMLVLPQVTIFAYCDESGTVDAIEVARPDDAGTTVEFDGVDLFSSEAEPVLEELRRRGHTVVVTEGGYSARVPDVLLALWRNGDETDPRTDLPLFFASALVARPSYHE